MLKTTIASIEERIRQGASISEENRAELLRLLATLRDEVNDLAQTREEQASSIAGFTEASAREAMRSEQDPELLELSIEGLKRSVREFEASHPRLVRTVNHVCTMLSNLGI